MVGLSQAPKDSFVLEPSAGAGVFLEALAEAGYQNVIGQEIDANVVDRSFASQIRLGSFVGSTYEQRPSLIIGNPPYVRWKNMLSAQRAELESDRLWKDHFNSLCDLLFYFMARSINLLPQGGELIFITPDFWLSTKHAGALRSFMIAHGAITDLIRFREAKVFAGVASSICIFRFEKGASASAVNVHDYISHANVDLPAKTTAQLLANRELFHAFEAPHPAPDDDGWTFLPRLDRERARALSEACANVRLGDVARIANGMVSGLDRAFRLADDAWPLLDEKERAATISVLKGKRIKSLVSLGTMPYVFVEHVKDEQELIEQYPHLYAQLLPFEKQLRSRYDYGKGRQWWHWSFLRSQKLFDDHRLTLMIPCKERITNKDRLRVVVAGSGIYPTQDVSAIRLHQDVRESEHYVAALLCSTLWFDWVCQMGLLKGGIAEFSERPLASLPVRLIDWNSQREAALHDEIVLEACQSAPDLGHIDALIQKLLSRQDS